MLAYISQAIKAALNLAFLVCYSLHDIEIRKFYIVQNFVLLNTKIGMDFQC